MDTDEVLGISVIAFVVGTAICCSGFFCIQMLRVPYHPYVAPETISSEAEMTEGLV
jgi:hypothetical protein